jgi:type IV secretory pathway protease TraF
MGLVVNVSDSAAPVGIYRVLWDAPIKRGDLVLLRNPLKREVAGPGDTVRFAPNGVWVNGHLLPNSKVPADSPYSPYHYCTIVLAPDQYLMMGDDPLSYDDRYTGPTPQSLVYQKVQRLWPF